MSCHLLNIMTLSTLLTGHIAVADLRFDKGGFKSKIRIAKIGHLGIAKSSNNSNSTTVEPQYSNQFGTGGCSV